MHANAVHLAVVSALMALAALSSDTASASCSDPDWYLVRTLCSSGGVWCDSDGCSTPVADLAFGEVVSEHPGQVMVSEVLRSDGTPPLTVGEPLTVNGNLTLGDEVLVAVDPRDEVVGTWFIVLADEGVRFDGGWMSRDTIREYAAADPPCDHIDYTPPACDDTGGGLALGCATGSGAGAAVALALMLASLAARRRAGRRDA